MFTHNINIITTEYEADKSQYAEQVFRKNEENINALLLDNSEAAALGKTHLSKQEAWQGLKWKAETPEKYIPVKENAIIPGSRKQTSYGETFDRLTIQPDFASGQDILVKEEVHIFEKETRILFLGRPVDMDEAKKYLKGANERNLGTGSLFHVEHAVKGSEANPIATWEMIRKSQIDPKNAQEAQIIANIKALISSLKGTNIYLQTIRQWQSLKVTPNKK